MSENLLQAPSTGAPRFPVIAMAVLGALLAAPVLGFLALDWRSAAACRPVTVDGGVLPGNIQYRVELFTCGAAATVYHDVALGAVGKPLSTAVTANNGAVPIGVARAATGEVIVRFDRPVLDGAREIAVPLKTTGSPRTRIDLQASAS